MPNDDGLRGSIDEGTRELADEIVSELPADGSVVPAVVETIISTDRSIGGSDETLMRRRSEDRADD